MTSRITRLKDHVYINSIFMHDMQNGASVNTLAKINITFDEPILTDPEQYYATIVRFDIPLNTAPLLVFPVAPNSGLTNLSNLIIGIRVGANDFGEQLIYVPDTTIIPQPNQNNPNTVFDSPYYYIYNYQSMINIINTALNAAYVASGSIGGLGSPYFYFDMETQLINLYVPEAFIGGGATIFINASLLPYLEAFHYTNVATNSISGRDYAFVFDNTPQYIYPSVLNARTNGFIGVAPPIDARIYKQTFKAIQYWASVRKIVITSNNLPISGESIPVVIDGNILTGQSSYYPIISDFTPQFENAQDARSIAHFLPSAEYRLSDMFGSVPLNRFDLQLFWEDQKGKVFPLYISYMQSASVKILFVKKSLYNK